MEIEIVMYQGKHCDEFLVREVKSGRCSLFYKGIVQMSWKEVNGVRTGGFIVYEKGKAQRSEDWNGQAGKEHRRIENCKNGLELVIEGDGVVYRGGLDHVESMKREGSGMEFDEKSGRVLRCGVWKNDELFQITQECESEDVMIEYEIEEGTSNLNVLNRHAVYEGGYVFDEEMRVFLRNGYGCEIEGGVAVREGVWERGELKESVQLFDGWYVKREGKEVFEWGLKAEDLKVEIHSWNEWEGVNKKVRELMIASNCCNEEEWKVLDVSELKCLKSIEIGDKCFENVNEVKLIGFKRLERVVIGVNSFTKQKDSCGYDPNRHFHLKNCERLKELKIGNHSFEEYSVCAIENVGSLELIEVGDDCFSNVNELKLIGMNGLERVLIGENCFTKHKNGYGGDIKRHFHVKNCERLRELKMGRYSFSDYSVCEIENVPSLEVIEVGELNEDSWSFLTASLELKSDSQRMN